MVSVFQNCKPHHVKSGGLLWFINASERPTPGIGQMPVNGRLIRNAVICLPMVIGWGCPGVDIKAKQYRNGLFSACPAKMRI